MSPYVDLMLVILSMGLGAPFAWRLAKLLFFPPEEDMREMKRELPLVAFFGFSYSPAWSWVMVKLGLLVLLTAAVVMFWYKVLSALVGWF